MSEREIEKLQEISYTLRRIDAKIRLLSLSKQAKAEYDENNYDDCSSICNKILETSPDNAVALRGLGCVAQTQGDYASALKYYKKALKSSLNKEIEYTLIGTLYYIEDKFEKAIKYFNLAIDINDNYDSAYEGRNQSMLEKHLQILDLQDSLIKREIF